MEYFLLTAHFLFLLAFFLLGVWLVLLFSIQASFLVAGGGISSRYSIILSFFIFSLATVRISSLFQGLNHLPTFCSLFMTDLCIRCFYPSQFYFCWWWSWLIWMVIFSLLLLLWSSSLSFSGWVTCTLHVSIQSFCIVEGGGVLVFSLLYFLHFLAPRLSGGRSSSTVAGCTSATWIISVSATVFGKSGCIFASDDISISAEDTSQSLFSVSTSRSSGGFWMDSSWG